MVWTVEDIANFNSVFSALRNEIIVNRFHLVVTVQTLGNSALIRDQDQLVSIRLQCFERLHDRGQDGKLFDAFRVITGVMIDDAVPVQEDCFVAQSHAAKLST